MYKCLNVLKQLVCQIIKPNSVTCPSFLVLLFVVFVF